MARVGDRVTYPKCGDTHTIAEGVQNVGSDRLTATRSPPFMTSQDATDMFRIETALRLSPWRLREKPTIAIQCKKPTGKRWAFDVLPKNSGGL